MGKKQVIISATKPEAEALGLWQPDLDFIWTDDDEPLVYTTPCGRDRDQWDGQCGCGRSLTGIDTMKGTTVFKIKTVDLSPDRFGSSHFAQSWHQSNRKLLENNDRLVQLLHPDALCQFVGNYQIQCIKTDGTPLPIATIDPNMFPDFREESIKAITKKSRKRS